MGTTLNKKTISQERFLTTKDVAKFINVNKKMISTLVNEKGFPTTSPGPGLDILSRHADAAPAIRAVAAMLDIDFIPLRWERFDLLVSQERFFERGISEFSESVAGK